MIHDWMERKLWLKKFIKANTQHVHALKKLTTSHPSSAEAPFVNETLKHLEEVNALAQQTIDTVTMAITQQTWLASLLNDVADSARGVQQPRH